MNKTTDNKSASKKNPCIPKPPKRREGSKKLSFIACGRSGRKDISDRHEELLAKRRS